MKSPLRIAWVATHPIQYQAPLIRALAKVTEVSVSAIFFSDFSTRTYEDAEFKTDVKWDADLLGGYDYWFAKSINNSINEIKTFKPIVFGLGKKITKQNFDVIIVHGWNHYGMLYASWLAKREGIKVLLRCEASDHVVTSRGLKKFFREIVVKYLLKTVDGVLAIGSRNRDFYLARGVPREKITLMPYCVDNDYFSSRAASVDKVSLKKRLGLIDDRPVLLYLSKLIERKHPDKLLEAYVSLPEPRPYLVFVGDGPLYSKLEDMVQVDRLDGVKLVGFKNQSETTKYYAIADILVLPSVNETWGLVVNEAMACGCAIISTIGVGASMDIVSSGRNGVIIDCPTRTELARAIKECIDGQRFLRMGRESQRIISSWGIKENMIGFQRALKNLEQH